MRENLLKIVVRGCLISALAVAGQSVSLAQTQSIEPPTANASLGAAETPGESAPRAAEQYRIGPTDVLGVRVSAGRFVPELSMETVEVDECGRIPLPSVQHEEQNEIKAAGLTRYELAENLRTFYKKYKRNPQVVVTIKEYKSQPVVINGAVVKPGQFQLRRAVRLRELLQSYAGGPTDRAGGSIQIARMPDLGMCESAPANTAVVSTDDGAISFLTFNLNDTLSAQEQANPFLQPGDVITLPAAKEVYITGNVLRPGAILLIDDNITVSRAIAMSGGLMPDSKKESVRIIRQDPVTKKNSEIIVNLKAIDKRQAPDVALQPNDIIDVQVSGGKRLLRSLVGTVVPTVGQLPVQIIR